MAKYVGENAIKRVIKDAKSLISTKVDKVTGKGLSTNDYTTEEKTKLSGIASGSQVNVIESVKVNNTPLAVSDKTVNIDLGNYALKSGAVGSIVLTMNETTYVISLQAKDVNGNNIGTAQTIDLPLESVVVSGSYNSTTKKVVLTLKDGSTVEFSVADLISGLQSEITATNKLASDLVDDSTSANKFVTSTEKATWNAKQNEISSSNKLDADLVDDASADNKFIKKQTVTSIRPSTMSAGTYILDTPKTSNLIVYYTSTGTASSNFFGVDTEGTECILIVSKGSSFSQWLLYTHNAVYWGKTYRSNTSGSQQESAYYKKFEFEKFVQGASESLTGSKVLVSDANGKVTTSNATATEIGFLSGVTSNIQEQLDAMQGSMEEITADDIDGYFNDTTL